ncbi:MAG: hypothetical protein V2A77_02730 [Pseudomonadota bacterium]
MSDEDVTKQQGEEVEGLESSTEGTEQPDEFAQAFEDDAPQQESAKPGTEEATPEDKGEAAEGEAAKPASEEEAKPTQTQEEQKPAEETVDWKAKAEALEREVQKFKAPPEGDTKKERSEPPPEVKEVFSGDPDLEKAVEWKLGQMLQDRFGVENLEELGKVVQTAKDYEVDRYARGLYNAVVNGYEEGGKFHEGVPDYPALLQKEEFRKWEAANLKDVKHPQQAIDRVTAWKKQLAEKAAATHDAQAQEKAGKVRQAGQRSLQSGGGMPGGGKTVKENSFNAGFEEGAATPS